MESVQGDPRGDCLQRPKRSAMRFQLFRRWTLRPVRGPAAASLGEFRMDLRPTKCDESSSRSLRRCEKIDFSKNLLFPSDPRMGRGAASVKFLPRPQNVNYITYMRHTCPFLHLLAFSRSLFRHSGPTCLLTRRMPTSAASASTDGSIA